MVDAFQNALDTALIVSADSDLGGPIEAVRHLFPGKRHETAVFDPAERSFAARWRPAKGSGASRTGLSELQSALQSWKLLTAVVSR